jgi:plastocyanin
MTRRFVVVFCLAISSFVLLAGCGGSSAGAPASTPTIPIGTRIHVTVIVTKSGHPDALYVPNPIRIRVGQTITWTNTDTDPHDVSAEFIGVSPTNPNEVFGEIGAQGFVMSRDGGITWRKADQGITDRNFNASVVRISPSSPNVVYTAAWGLHFYASKDGGQHWTRKSTLIH